MKLLPLRTPSLKQFLIRNGLYGRYLLNMSKNSPLSEDHGNSLTKLFVWKDSAEGHQFWSDIHRNYNHETNPSHNKGA